VPGAREVERRLLVDGDVAVGAGVDPRRAGQHRAAHPVTPAGLKDIAGPGDVDLDGCNRTSEGVARVRHPSEVEHDLTVTGRLHHRSEIQHVDVPVGDIRPVRGTDVEDSHRVTGRDHPVDDMGSDESPSRR
jgi:hypothetical protein